jgi:hypothetical protein
MVAPTKSLGDKAKDFFGGEGDYMVSPIKFHGGRKNPWGKGD